VPCDRRSGVHPGRRFAFASASALTIGVVLALPAAGIAAPLLDVTVYRGATPQEQTIDSSDLSGCPTAPSTNYAEHGPGGEVFNDSVGGSSSWDLETALTCGSDPILPSIDDFSSITVFNPDQGTPEAQAGSTITPGDLSAPTDFADTSQQPLIATTGSNTEYDRPYRGGNDFNASDKIDTSSGAIPISIFTGQTLEVTVIPSATQVAAGETVTFTPTVVPESPNLSYRWDFGNATPNTSTNQTPTTTYDTAGNWKITLQVTDDQGDGGVGATTVTVGTPPPGTTTGPTTGAFTTSTPTTSSTTSAPPTRRHHGHAPATSSSTSTTSTTKTSASQTTTTSTTTRTSPATTTETSTTSTAAGPPAASGSGSSGAAPPLATTPAATTPTGSATGTTPAPAAPTQTTHTPAPHPGSQLPLVTGRLIASVNPQAPGASPLVHTIAGGIPAAGAIAGNRSRTSPAAIIAGILAALALLGLGALRERQGAFTWRSLRSPWSRRS
jgi:plastocyanin